MSQLIHLSNVRLSFPNLIKPQTEFQGKPCTPKWGADFIMELNHPGFAQFSKAHAQLAMDKWKEHFTNVMNTINANHKLRCYGNGNDRVSQQNFQIYDGYKDMVYITAKRDTQPQIILADRTAVDPSNTMAYELETRKMYGGCRVNVAIKPWLQDNTSGRGIRCELVAIQFAGDDAPFGESTPDASGLFGSIANTPVAAAPQVTMPPAPFATVPSFLQGIQ